MIQLLEVTPMEAGKEVIEAAKSGQIDQLIQQVTTMGLEAGKSILLAVVLTFVFTALVNLFMSFRMEKINMAESLKAVE